MKHIIRKWKGDEYSMIGKEIKIRDTRTMEMRVQERVGRLAQKIITDHTGLYGLTVHTSKYRYYIDRLYTVPNYGIVQGHKMLALICRCAFHDNQLTDGESINIINVCHDERWHNILLEVNYNEGWN